MVEASRVKGQAIRTADVKLRFRVSSLGLASHNTLQVPSPDVGLGLCRLCVQGLRFIALGQQFLPFQSEVLGPGCSSEPFVLSAGCP